MDAKKLSIRYGANQVKGRTLWEIIGPTGVVWASPSEMERMFNLLYPSGGLRVEHRWNGTGMELPYPSQAYVTMPSGLKKEIRVAFVALVASLSELKD